MGAPKKRIGNADTALKILGIIGIVGVDRCQAGCGATGHENIATGGNDFQFVANREFDIDVLDCIGVFAHAGQWDNDIFVNLERIGVARDCRRASAL